MASSFWRMVLRNQDYLVRRLCVSDFHGPGSDIVLKPGPQGKRRSMERPITCPNRTFCYRDDKLCLDDKVAVQGQSKFIYLGVHRDWALWDLSSDIFDEAAGILELGNTSRLSKIAINIQRILETRSRPLL